MREAIASTPKELNGPWYTSRHAIFTVSLKIYEKKNVTCRNHFARTLVTLIYNTHPNCIDLVTIPGMRSNISMGFFGGFLLAFLSLSSIKSIALALAEEVAPDLPSEAAIEGEDTLNVPDCGLYLAVSSTSTAEEPKWGLYAGHAIPKHGRVGSGELAIQTFHLLANALADKDAIDSVKGLADIVDHLEQYIWVPHGSGGQFELEESGKIVTAVPGVGVLGGCEFSLLPIVHARCSSSIVSHILQCGLHLQTSPR